MRKQRKKRPQSKRNDSAPIHSLEADARRMFGELSLGETELLRDFCGGSWKKNEVDRASTDVEMDRELLTGVVRSEILRWLCGSSEAAKLVDVKGLRVRQLHVIGDLDLESVKCSFPLSIENSLIDGKIILDRSHFPFIRIKNSDIGSLTAIQSRIDTSLALFGLKSTGGLRLFGATINANLTLDAACLSSLEECTLNLEGASIGGSVSMRKGFRSNGHIRFYGTQVGRNIESDGTIYARHAKNALLIEGSRVGGSILLRNGFRCIGGMRIYRVTLEGTLDLQSARFMASKKFALFVYGCRIKGSLVVNTFEAKDRSKHTGGLCITSCHIDEHLNLSKALISAKRREACNLRNLKVDGQLLIRSARIEGELNLSKTVVMNDAVFTSSLFYNEKGWAIRGDSFQCKGSLVLGEKFEAKGSVGLSGSNIGDEFRADGSTFLCERGTALSFAETSVRRAIFKRCKIIGKAYFNAANIVSTLDFSNSDFTGELILSRIQIGGHLWLNEAKLTNASLSASYLRCKGSIFLDEFKAYEGANFYGAIIDGDMVSSKSTYESTKISLNLQRARIGGHLLLEMTKITGAVSLQHATVGGQLRLSRAVISARRGEAVNATGCFVGGEVLINEGFTARGAIIFDRARIVGNLRLSNCTVRNRQDVAVSLVGTSIQGNIAAESVFNISGYPQTRLLGTIDASNASVDGSVDLSGVRVFNRSGIALNGERMRIKGVLDLRSSFSTNGIINLQNATVGSYFDANLAWASARGLSLQGFIYHTIAPSDGDQRLRWLERGRSRLDTDDSQKEQISLQPYEQLIFTLKKQGHEHDARRVSIAKQAYLGEHGIKSRWERWRHMLYGFTIRYGFRPQHALVFAPFFLVSLCAAFYAGADELMVPANPIVANSVAAGAPLPRGYPSFNAVAYSLEMFVPILNLQQRESWRPDDQAICIRGPKRCGFWLRFYLFFHVSFGWIITTLAVAGFAGLVRKD